MGFNLCIEHIEQIYLYKYLYNEVYSSIKNNIELEIGKTVQQLIALISSEKLIPLLYYEFNSILFYDIISLYEMKEKFLSLKIIFPLFEELRKN